MVREDVSGRAKHKKMNEKPLRASKGQIVHLQPRGAEANPPMRGPITGPHTAV